MTQEDQLKSKLNFNIVSLDKWLPDFKKPLIISGPCSAENEKQLMDTAESLLKTGRVTVFRAGIWKPRTRPNSFEGVGEEGLLWLHTVKKETGFLTATEVANPRHVELCLKHEVDILWAGARTVANPFSIQDIADSLKGVDIPVMVKNPVNPDLDLWLGALERIHNAGITKILAIHRGFSTLRRPGFRNEPLWELPVELKILCPDLPIICDPSHIAGRRDLIPNVAQKAIDMDMTGLMIESHINPENALSDASQQITPEELAVILARLVIKKPAVFNPEFNTILDQLRTMIDELDDNIMRTLASRMEISEKIGRYKRDNRVTIFQLQRWKEIVKRRVDAGEEMGLGRNFVKQLLKLIHRESINRQSELINHDDKEP